MKDRSTGLDALVATIEEILGDVTNRLMKEWGARRTGQRDPASYETKHDLTPVTDVDRWIEARARRIIKEHYPSHRIVGEEFGGAEIQQEQWVWILDPIDGTKSYVRGIPVFGVQVAVAHEGAVVAAASHAPALGETIIAQRGQGALVNHQQVHGVSDVKTLDQALLCHGSIKYFSRRGHLQALVDLSNRVWGTRGLEDFWSYHLLADGKIDVVVEAEAKIWDIAAASLIVEEAGGRATDLAGRSIGLASTSIVATNRHLHEHVLRFFAGKRR
jgi:histidinol-phosphatase